MRKKILIILLFLLLSPLVVAADDDGLLPCGPGTGEACNICHLFELIDNILEFVMFKFVPVLAGLMLVIGGIWFYFSGASEENKRRAKAILTSVVIGIVLVLAAWIIVNTILVETGIVEDGSLWYDIECSVAD